MSKKKNEINWDAIDLRVLAKAKGIKTENDKILCPKHTEKTPSFHIYKNNGHCHGCGYHPNILTFMVDLLGFTDKKSACKELINMGYGMSGSPKLPPPSEGGGSDDSSKQPYEKVRWDEPKMRFMVEGEGEDAEMKKVYLKPVSSWDYLSKDGQLLFRACKFIDPTTGKKKPRPFYKEGDKWVTGAMTTENAPLYDLPRIAANPNKVVCVCEGEKAAEALNDALEKVSKQLGKPIPMVATTYPFGADAWKKVHWDDIYGRDVQLWPDNDKKGKARFYKLGEFLSLNCTVRYFSPPEDWPEKDDASDFLKAGGTIKDVITLFRENSVDIMVKNEEQEVKVDRVDAVRDNQFFRVLGFNDQGITVIYSKKTQGLIELISLSTSNSFLRIAPWWWWSKTFNQPDIGVMFSKASVASAQDFINTVASTEGFFEDFKVLKSGGWHWIDVQGSKTPILHAGNVLYSNSCLFPLHKMIDPKKHVWIRKRAVDWGKGDEKINQSVINEIKRFVNKFKWENEYHAMLIKGWIALAPICGLLPFRPSVWITGETGSGKTTFVGKFIQKIMGGTVFHAAGASTEPGLRGLLQKEGSIAIAVDERELKAAGGDFEVAKLDAFMMLVKLASSAFSSPIIKADTPGSDTRKSKLNSVQPSAMFLIASVGMPNMEESQSNRIADVKMIPVLGEEGRKYYSEFEISLDEFFTRVPNVGKDFLVWCRTNYQGLIDAAVEGKKIALKHNVTLSQRNADVIGTLLGAGIYFDNMGQNLPAVKFSLQMTEFLNSSYAVPISHLRGYIQAIQHIKAIELNLSHLARTDPSDNVAPVKIPEVTIGALYSHAKGKEVPLINLEPKDAIGLLCHSGVRLHNLDRGKDDDVKQGHVAIAMNHPKINRGLARLKSEFGQGQYRDHLLRAPNAKSTGNRVLDFAGTYSLAVIIPESIFSGVEGASVEIQRKKKGKYETGIDTY